MNIKWSLTFALCAGLTFSLFSQNNLWSEADETALRSAPEERWIVPDSYRSLTLDVAGMEKKLAGAAPHLDGGDGETIVSLPMPDGTFQEFSIKESPIMAEGLARRLPNIKTYMGQGISDPRLSAYLDLTPAGFHGMVIGSGRPVFIDPYFRGRRTAYVSYGRSGISPTGGQHFSCGQTEAMPFEELAPVGNRSAITTLRTYRTAISATGEYTQFFGSKANAEAAIVTTMNRVRGIFETELAISFLLIANNGEVVYDDPATDPFPEDPTLAQNQANLDAVIGSANYDLGHLFDFSASTGGVAGLGVACNSSNKGRGYTGSPSPTGDHFNVDYVSHEIGHQLGAHHCFNGDGGSCAGSNRNAATAYEPNSGTTIMAYAGACGDQNIQQRSESYFHQVSLQQITTYVTTGGGAGCPALSNTGNNAPTVDADPDNMDGKYIPMNTPFELRATGGDADGDALTFCWEQWDLGAAGAVGPNSDGPLFRSFAPVASGGRSFPRLDDILDNSGSMSEYLPSTDRALNFKCTVRDGKAGGGASASGQIGLHVTNAAADFAIASQNNSANVEGQITVLWNVGNTNASPVNCANVDILLSVDGGEKFTALVSGTPNDGTQPVSLPSTATGQARLKVKCSDNVFFDLNNADLRIVPAAATCAEQVTNGNFSANGTGWEQFSSKGQPIISGWGKGRTNNDACPWLGYLDDETASISQAVPIPADPHFAKLEFWYRFLRIDCGGDVFQLKVNGAVVKTFSLCNNEAAMDWTRELVDLYAYRGTSPEVKFELVTNGNNPTDLLIDDVSLYTCEGGQFALLPVELVGFQANVNRGAADLTWQTESEKNNRGFEVEQKNEEGQFRKIGFVAGNGTTSERHKYSFRTEGLSPGRHYFRLRQMDEDGGFSLSPVRSVFMEGGQKLSVFPNPASEVVFFEMDLPKATPLRLEVRNSTGQLVRLLADDRFAEGQYRLPLKVSGLPKGVYFYRLAGSGWTEEGRFVVE